MNWPQRTAFLIDEFSLRSPAQQLLDRFIVGFNRDGTFESPPQPCVTAWIGASNPPALIEARRDDFGLQIAPTPEAAVREAQAIVVVPPGAGAQPNEALVRIALQAAPAGTPVFVHGLLAGRRQAAQTLVEIARQRRLPLASGTVLPSTFRLPDVDLPAGAHVQEALIVAQGNFPDGEFLALDGLLPVLERRKGGEAGVRRFRLVEGGDVWQAGDDRDWSWPLLASALSRSHTPQGNPVLDGRTEDLVGLGLVPKLARQPRAWLLDHHDGLRTSLLVLDGVVADFSFAVRLADRSIVSAQLFRAPKPQEEHYSRLVGVLVDFLFLLAAPLVDGSFHYRSRAGGRLWITRRPPRGVVRIAAITWISLAGDAAPRNRDK